MGLSLERIIGLYCLIAASIYMGTALRGRRPTRFSIFTPVTLVTVLLIAGALALQLHFPFLLPLMERNANAVGAGEPWRLITALFFQDGGLPGGLFNLVALTLVGSSAERLWGYSRWLLLYFGCGLLDEIVALTLQPIGAGNSIATLSLSGALLSRGWWAPHLALGRPLAVLGAVIGAGLIWKGDIHGWAVVLGMLAGSCLPPLQKPLPSPTYS